MFSGSKQVVSGVQSGNRDGGHVGKWGWGGKGVKLSGLSGQVGNVKFGEESPSFSRSGTNSSIWKSLKAKPNMPVGRNQLSGTQLATTVGT